jgi:hypothetical protein
MRVYVEVAKRAFQQQLAYRTANLAGLATNAFWGALRSFLFLGLFQGREVAAGWSVHDAIDYSPGLRAGALARRIGAVFGQRAQLWRDLPLIDSLALLCHIYRVPAARFTAKLSAVYMKKGCRTSAQASRMAIRPHATVGQRPVPSRLPGGVWPHDTRTLLHRLCC